MDAAGLTPAPGRPGEQQPTPDSQWLLAIAIGVVVVFGIYFAHDAELFGPRLRMPSAPLTLTSARIEFRHFYPGMSKADADANALRLGRELQMGGCPDKGSCVYLDRDAGTGILHANFVDGKLERLDWLGPDPDVAGLIEAIEKKYGSDQYYSKYESEGMSRTEWRNGEARFELLVEWHTRGIPKSASIGLVDEKLAAKSLKEYDARPRPTI